MDIFLSAFDDIPDPRADNARHDLCELLVVAFVAVLCGATSCAEMADFGRAKEHVFRGFLKLKHAIPSHDTFSTVFRMIDPKALDAAFGRVLVAIAAVLGDGDVIAIDGKALRGARDKGQSARTRMMVSAYAARLRMTLATVAADHGGELEAAIEVLGLVALKGKVVTADARASLVRREMASRSACATRAMMPMVNSLASGMSQARNCTPLSRRVSRNAALRERRSSLAMTRVAPVSRASWIALVSSGRLGVLPLSTSVKRARTSAPREAAKVLMLKRCASSPRPLAPCLAVETRSYAMNLGKAINLAPACATGSPPCSHLPDVRCADVYARLAGLV
jgi:hypothetical protein